MRQEGVGHTAGYVHWRGVLEGTDGSVSWRRAWAVPWRGVWVNLQEGVGNTAGSVPLYPAGSVVHRCVKGLSAEEVRTGGRGEHCVGRG